MFRTHKPDVGALKEFQVRMSSNFTRVLNAFSSTNLPYLSWLLATVWMRLAHDSPAWGSRPWYEFNFLFFYHFSRRHVFVDYIFMKRLFKIVIKIPRSKLQRDKQKCKNIVKFAWELLLVGQRGKVCARARARDSKRVKRDENCGYDYTFKYIRDSNTVIIKTKRRCIWIKSLSQFLIPNVVALRAPGIWKRNDGELIFHGCYYYAYCGSLQLLLYISLSPSLVISRRYDF